MDQDAVEEWTVNFNGNSGNGFVISMVTGNDKSFYTYAYASAEMDYFGQTIQKGAFLAKQDGSGEVIWLKQFEGFISNRSDVGNEIVIDPTNEYVYITGTFRQPLVIPDEYTLQPGEDGSFFILKYSTDGTFELAIQESFQVGFPCLA